MKDSILLLELYTQDRVDPADKGTQFEFEDYILGDPVLMLYKEPRHWCRDGVFHSRDDFHHKVQDEVPICAIVIKDLNHDSNETKKDACGFLFTGLS